MEHRRTGALAAPMDRGRGRGADVGGGLSRRAWLASCLVLACAGETPGEDGGDGATIACLPAEVFLALERHALDLAATAGLLAGHPSEAEVTGFLLAPALPFPPALSASFAGPLVMTCSKPLVYDAFCEEGRCSQIECTGSGAGWLHHLWLEDPVAADGWSFQAVDVYIRWDDGETGTTFTLSTTATSPSGRDVSMMATGVMDPDMLYVEETFPALHPAGVTRLEYIDDASGYRGQLTIDGVEVADVDATGRLDPTGSCPRT